MDLNYSKKTIEMYMKIRELSNSITKNMTLDEKKELKGKIKCFKNNWGRHVEAKNLSRTDINKQVICLLNDIDVKLNLKYQLKNELLDEGINIVNSYNEVMRAKNDLNIILNKDLQSIIDKLEAIRVNLTGSVNIMDIKNKSIDDVFINQIAASCITEGEELQANFNKVLDGIDLILDVKSNIKSI